ncbi:tail fiber assembly protein [Xenorhabdus stockiae]|uniref:tail fiber assembly protein n=1 Tax=Xenorhabdus stockiae TaxID=351614 RepID=UPI003CEE1C35
MLHFRKFSRYPPSNEGEKEIEKRYKAIFYRSEDNQDWYACISKFNNDTYKIKYDSNGIIVAISKDASTICPENGSIVEVELLPDNIDTLGNWQYSNGSIKLRSYTQDELIAHAYEHKKKLLNKANAVIMPLEDAVELDISTVQEITELTKWKRYRVLLNRIDCSTAPDIVWPEQPKE